MFGSDEQRKSQKNGTIVVRRGKGRGNVIVDGYNQTGEGLNAIWRDALQRVRSAVPSAPHVLILGLGGGGMLREVYALFPAASIVAVEHDPEMVKLTKEFKFHEPFPLPRIIESDAFDALLEMDDAFDLIVVDLFRGGQPSPLLFDNGFTQALKGGLGRNGSLIVNAGGTASLLDTTASQFSHVKLWRCEANFLGWFANKKLTAA